MRFVILKIGGDANPAVHKERAKENQTTCMAIWNISQQACDYAELGIMCYTGHQHTENFIVYWVEEIRRHKCLLLAYLSASTVDRRVLIAEWFLSNPNKS